MAATTEIATEELGALKEDEVMRRLCTDQAAGLTEEEALRRRQAYGPNMVVHPPSQVYSKKFRILMSIALHLGWDYPFRRYKRVAGTESWSYYFPKNKYALLDILVNFLLWMTLIAKYVLLVVSSVGESSYELAAVIPLFVAILAASACFVAKHIVNHAKVSSVEAKAFALRVKVLRDGMWRDEHSHNLVPGDIIFLKCGDIVPADARVLRGASIRTSCVMAKRFTPGCVNNPLIYYAWTVSRGQGTAVVIATGHGVPMRWKSWNSPVLFPERFARPGQLRNGIAAAGTFCVSLILVGTAAEVAVFLSQGHKHKGLLNNYFFMPLISGIPMAMPAVLYLALALGSLRLSSLGMASRGTVALEDLACVDVILFNLTGTLTCNKPCFHRGKIQVLADGVDKDGALLLAARASRAHHELYKEPIDEAILDLLDDPQQAITGIQVEKHCVPYFIVDLQLTATSYIDENGSRCIVVKGHPATVARNWGCSEEVKKQIYTLIDKLASEGCDTIAVGLTVNSRCEFIGLLPFKDDIRSDSAKAVDGLIDMGLNIRVLSESSLSFTKQICGRLGNLGLNVIPAASLFASIPYKREVHLHINGISNIFQASYTTVLRGLKDTFKCHCAMVGHNLLDVDAIRESNIGISIADAADCTKSESDLVLTQPVLMPLSSAVGISRNICQIMRVYTVYAVSSTIHIVGVRVLLLQWNFNLACLLTLMVAACHNCTSFVMLFESAKQCQSPDRWKVKKVVATGAAFGSYITLSTTIFFGVASSVFGSRGVSWKASDQEIKTALFLQMSIVNQTIGLLSQSYSGHPISCPGPLITSFFIFTQLVATIVSVYGDVGFVLAKGVGWGCAGFIWLYNFVLLLALVLICHKWKPVKLLSK